MTEPTTTNEVWCDDCHGYTHMPYCPSYRAVDEISDAATKGERQRKQLEYEASEKFDYGTRYRARQELAVLNRSQDQQHAAQLRFLGNRAEELSSLLAGMTTERDELQEALRQVRSSFQIALDEPADYLARKVAQRWLAVIDAALNNERH